MLVVRCTAQKCVIFGVSRIDVCKRWGHTQYTNVTYGWYPKVKCVEHRRAVVFVGVEVGRETSKAKHSKRQVCLWLCEWILACAVRFSGVSLCTESENHLQSSLTHTQALPILRTMRQPHIHHTHTYISKHAEMERRDAAMQYDVVVAVLGKCRSVCVQYCYGW